MKPYGVKRILDVQWPDVYDILHYGLKSCIGSLKGKGGEWRGIHKRKSRKRAARRYWKRKARLEGKKACQEIE